MVDSPLMVAGVFGDPPAGHLDATGDVVLDRIDSTHICGSMPMVTNGTTNNAGQTDPCVGGALMTINSEGWKRR